MYAIYVVGDSLFHVHVICFIAVGRGANHARSVCGQRLNSILYISNCWPAYYTITESRENVHCYSCISAQKMKTSY